MKSDHQPNLQSTIFRLVLAWLSFYVVLTVFFEYFGSAYINWMLPLVRAEMEWVAPDYNVMELKLVGHYLEYDVKISRTVVRPDGVFVQQGGQMRGAIAARMFYLQPVFLIATVLTWPGLSTRKRIYSLALCVPVLHLLVALDAPIFLINGIEEGYVHAEGYEKSGMIDYWGFLLNNGGRQVWALLGGLLCVLPFIKRRAEHAFTGVKRNDPCPCGSGKKYKKCCMP